MIYIHIISLFTYLTCNLHFKKCVFLFWIYLLNQNIESVRAKTMSSLKKIYTILKGSDQFSHSVDSLWPHEWQHVRPPCLSPTPGAYSNSCPSSRWCHPAISSSVIPFSSYPQSLPASGSFPMSQLFTWFGQSTGVSASASILPMSTQDWSPLGWISLQSKGLSRVFYILYGYYKIFAIFPVVYKTRSLFPISKSIHVAAHGKIFILLMVEYSSLSTCVCICVSISKCKCIYTCIYTHTYIRTYRHHIFFIHSCVGGHLGCFHILAVVNSVLSSLGCKSFSKLGLCLSCSSWEAAFSHSWYRAIMNKHLPNERISSLYTSQ